MNALELWGGAECTVNRVGEAFADQLVATGHHHRFDDIDRIAEIGVSALRFPVLWERVSPDDRSGRDWSWSDPRLERLRQLAIRPIVGLVHHGSGPRYSSLLDPGFAAGVAAHALATARRYPWVTDWTPINEPLTTARFSTLYGHWHPHARDERLFWTALLNQIDAVRQAMAAIRSVNPAARLVQTDDLGRTYATAALRDQAAFDNLRRWAGWDLLCGMVAPGHGLWQRLVDLGLEARLRAIVEDPCPPAVIGINHYLTSDRFLDHRVQRYPPGTCGGNGRDAYADVEAVRVLDPPPQGLRGAIADAWERYGLPIALTEVHNGCSREEQLRWLDQAWTTACAARERGIEVRAVTVWSLFGSQGWNTLLTGPGEYEPGAFDIRGEVPRRTALGKLAAALGRGERAAAAVDGTGWWRREIRFHHPPVPRPARLGEHSVATPGTGTKARPILITGATGTLGQAMAATCSHRDLSHVLLSRSELDLLDEASVAAALERHTPWAVINAAGWVRVDDAEDAVDACLRVNGDGAVALARACADRGIATLSVSSDLVFDGSKAEPYRESDAPRPLNVYGRSKVQMEEAIAGLAGGHLIVRTAAFFSPFDNANFAAHLVAAARSGEPFAAPADRVVTPTYVPDLCDAALDLLIDGERGLWHLTNDEALSWAEFATRIAAACGLQGAIINPVAGDEMGWRARRPPGCGLTSERGRLLPPLESAISRFAERMGAPA